MIKAHVFHFRFYASLLLVCTIALVLLYSPMFTHASPPRPTCPPPPSTPGVPPPPIPCDDDPNDEDNAYNDVDQTDFCLRLSANPSTATSPSAVVSYTLSLENNSGSRLSGTQVVFSFDDARQEIIDVNPGNPSVWVNEVLTNAVKLQFEHIDSMVNITSTLRFQTQSTVKIGDSLAARAFLYLNGRPMYSNRVVLDVGVSPVSNPTTELVFTPSSGPPTTLFIANSDRFASRESVGLWYHSPDGGVVSAGNTQADSLGNISITFPATSLNPGQYRFVAQGVCSKITVVGVFTVASD